MTFTLSQASITGGVTFFVHNGLVLEEVALSPGMNQYTLSGTTVTMGVAPDAGDTLTAFISTSGQHGLALTEVVGAQNGSNTLFTLGSAPPSGSNVILVFNGMVQEEVGAAPGVNQFTISGTSITFGLAPNSADVLVAYIQETATVLFREVVLVGEQNGGNVRFTSSFLYAAGYTPSILVIYNGLVSQEVTTTPLVNQYTVALQDGVMTVTVGLAPSSTDTLEVYTVGVTVGAGVVSLLNLRQLERRLIVLMNKNIDAEESRLALDESWRSTVTEQSLSFLKIDGSLATVASKSAGTLSVTQGSIAMFGSGTSPATADIGGYFLLNDEPYRIVSVDVNNEFYVVDTPYAGETDTAVGYTLYHNRYVLDPDVMRIVSMTGANWRLDETSLQYLDWLDPGRTVFGEPYWYAYRGLDGNKLEEIEVWPIPQSVYSYRYTGMRRSVLSQSTQRVEDISSLILKYGAMIACRIVANKRATEKDWAGAQYWTGQGTVWQQDAESGLFRWKKMDRKRFGRRRHSRLYHPLLGRTDVDF